MRAVSSLTRTLSVMSVVFLIWLALASSGHAQSDNAQISGVIRDPNGAVVSGAKVVAKSESKEFERTGTTNAEGYYFLTNIPPGMYTVWAERDGFKRTQATNKKLDPSTPTTVDLTLETGNVTETVSIVAAATTVQSETATVGKLIDQKQLENSGLNGRNPLFLALLKPGVNGGALGQFSFGLTTGGLNINGSRTQDNLITFDGAVAVRTRSNGTSIGVADVDSTQEVQILTANYNAEYGRSAGGQIRIVTKSGQQSFHGTAYEFLRNSALNANSFTRNHLDTAGKTPCDQFEKADNCRPSPFRYNQFGYSLSGPVILPFTNYNKDRSKLFWLWGQEWVRQRAASTTVTTVPSLKMRNGDFSELLDPSNRFYGRQVIINDPKTGKPFLNNVIPASSLSANGLALLRAYPEPTPGFIGPGTANFTQTRPASTNQRKDTLSLDYYPTEKHQIRWRMQLYHFDDLSAFRTNLDRAPQFIVRPNQTVSLNWVFTISPTWINEFLGTASRDQVQILRRHRGRPLQAKHLRNQLSVHLPQQQGNLRQDSDGQLRERLYRSRWRSVPIVVRRPDLRFLGQHHQHPGQSHPEGRLPLGKIGRERFRSDQCQRCAGRYEQPERAIRVSQHESGRLGTRCCRCGPWAVQLVCRNRQPVLHAIPGPYVRMVYPGRLARKQPTAPGAGAPSYDHPAVLQPLGQHGCL